MLQGIRPAFKFNVVIVSSYLIKRGENMFKKIITAVLATLMLLIVLPTKVLADESIAEQNEDLTLYLRTEIDNSYIDENGTKIYTHHLLSLEEKKAQILEQLRKKYNLTDTANMYIEEVKDDDISMLRFDQSKVGTTTKTVDLGRASNQPYSVSFEKGGYIYWHDGEPTVSVSFSINGGLYSVGISLGFVQSSVSGYSMYVAPGESAILGVRRQVKFTRWHIVGEDPAVPSTWYDEYVNTYEILHTSFYNAI